MKKAAVIGLGVIAPTHLAAIEANPEITLVGVCDRKPEKKSAAPENVPFYTDYEEMLREVKPDVVHICLPHYLHYPVSKKAVEMGINVFSEKPVALNAAEAESFAALEKAHPEVRIGLCLQNRVNATVVRLKEIIDSGEFGRVTGINGVVLWYRGKEYYEAEPWRGKWAEAGGGCMINQSVHTLDLLYYLGGNISAVKGVTTQLFDYGVEVEDTAAVRLVYENGASGLFFATIANYKNESVRISVKCEKAEFTITDGKLYRANDDGTRELICEDEKIVVGKFYYGASHKKLIDGFYKAVENGTRDYIHASDAVMSIRLIDAIQESSRQGKLITL